MWIRVRLDSAWTGLTNAGSKNQAQLQAHQPLYIAHLLRESSEEEESKDIATALIFHVDLIMGPIWSRESPQTRNLVSY
jgi:hypothetical protein